MPTTPTFFRVFNGLTPVKPIGTAAALLSAVDNLDQLNLEMKAMALTINDLPRSDVLDRAAADLLRGGFLEGLVPHSVPGQLNAQGIVNNFFIDVQQTVFQLNPVNLTVVNGSAGGNIVNDITVSPIAAASPMTLIQGSLPGGATS